MAKSIAEPTRQFTYSTAPARILERHGITISTRQLQRWVELRRVDHLKIGHRVYFTDENLDALIDSLTVKAVR
ncbi:hypothetical protein [Microbacterium terrisoli]|uniref:hypothetical protein n=1 Tax=Microbacterium terrisoli TaxID=3242192 RepID=UPI002804B36A|nr:hypothetical protein [Microbacterium protaetiae]